MVSSVRLAALLVALCLLWAGCSSTPAQDSASVSSTEPSTTTSEPASTTTTTTTTLPPVVLEVQVVLPDGSPAPDGVMVRLNDSAESPTVGGRAALAVDAGSEVRVTVDAPCPTADCDWYRSIKPVQVEVLPGRNEAVVEVLPFSVAPTTSGFLTTNELWSGEVTLTGTIIIPEGVELVIEPGTAVRIDSTDDEQYLDGVSDRLDKPQGILILAEGRVSAHGTIDAPIRVSSVTESSWAGIRGELHGSYVDALDAEEVNLSEDSVVTTSTFWVATMELGGVLTDSRVILDRMTIGHGAELAHSVAYLTEQIEVHGAHLHHNHVISRLQPECLRLVGLAANTIRNNVFVRCPVLAVSDPEGQPSDADLPPLVVENNVFYTAQTDKAPAFSISNRFAKTVEDERDPEQYDTVPVVFRNNVIEAEWLTGVFLGSRPLHLDSIFDANSFNTPYLEGDGRHYDYGGEHQGPAIDGEGVYALDRSWVDWINETWTDRSTGNDQVKRARFVDPEWLAFRLQPDSLLIDAGSPDILDADGSPSDIGAYGGPGSEGWLTETVAPPRCTPEEDLFYEEDFEDGEAQGWHTPGLQIDLSPGWHIDEIDGRQVMVAGQVEHQEHPMAVVDVPATMRYGLVYGHTTAPITIGVGEYWPHFNQLTPIRGHVYRIEFIAGPGTKTPEVRVNGRLAIRGTSGTSEGRRLWLESGPGQGYWVDDLVVCVPK